MLIKIPYPSIVLPIGVSGSGKSTFVENYFKKSEVLSSDFFRYMIGDDQGNQSVSKDAFEALHFITTKRLEHQKMVVIDATNVQKYARENSLTFAKEYSYPITAIILDLPIDICVERIESRERKVPLDVIERQKGQLEETLLSIQDEGFDCIHILASQEEIDAVSVKIEEQII